jgi:hypothetical protein
MGEVAVVRNRKVTEGNIPNETVEAVEDGGNVLEGN